MLLIGSVAMAHHGLKRSENQSLKDLDIIAFPEELDFFDGCEVVKKSKDKVIFKDDDVYFEIEVAHAGSNQEALMKMLELTPDIGLTIAPKDVLYTLKMSHRYLKNSSHFKKTMYDIHLMRKAWGFESVPQHLQEWFKWREKDTYTYDHPKLNQSKEDFFDTSVFKENPYVYDHDSLHEVVKIYDKPAYTYFVDGPVKVSKEKFFTLPLEIQLASVYEESCVLALERAIIPNNSSQDWAFFKALEKVCTSIASGWWREFAWEHYAEVVSLYREQNCDLRLLLEVGLVYDIVKPFEEEKV